MTRIKRIEALRAERFHCGQRGSAHRDPATKDIDMWSTNDPEWGILSTPVVSDDKAILYVVAWHDDGPAGLQYTAPCARSNERNTPSPAGDCRCFFH